ncbi:MAG: 50S ribosomal protein L22 [Candidatus Eisenbacteria bacterium]
MDAIASARFVRISPRKMGHVSQLVRGRNVDEALRILQFTHKGAARVLEKLLKAAVSNAVNIEGKIDVETLRIREIRVGPGPTMKRHLPRALGRATPILKRSSHITVVVTTPHAVSGRE